ncbi:unnamed protein product [Lactuca saligna]|uniref:Helitron helicase-like domain-containing protein n=1 Tax=Lactuca saligna TaxID=75948 RepID=A0AA35YTD0_LACSI|nr:unnamed protein product [Lactuca saligna]
MAVPSKWRADDGGSSFVPPSVGCRRRSRRLQPLSLLPDYMDCGDCMCVCAYCGALFWYIERIVNTSTADPPRYNHCCRGGDVVLPYPSMFPTDFVALYQNSGFLRDIRAYNNMFSMTSFGANVDEDVNDNRGTYVFKISGQISHKIGSLCPDPIKGPRFLQLYLFDTGNEVENRLRPFDHPSKSDLDCNIVSYLVNFLGANNEYVRTFKTAKQIAEESNLQSYAVRLFNNVADRRYDLPSSGSLGCIVTGDDTISTTSDIIIHSQSGRP